MRNLVLAALILSTPAFAADSKDAPTVTFGGYVDTFYAYDFDQPPTIDRQFTTTAVRSNEFNVNLAYLEARISGPRIHGRVALQAGTSVQANTVNEPSIGVFSGPILSRHMQEAYAGYQVTDSFWIDAGIYFSHIGFEGFISRDNWTYTRSLGADFSPYYQSGVRASWQVNNALLAQLHIINGWQNISENNSNKALGLQLAYNPSTRLSLIYNNFYGIETGTFYRFFNDFIARVSLSDSLQVAGVADVGLQKNSANDTSTWTNLALLARYAFNEKWAAGYRLERFSDPDQVVATTGLAGGFTVAGASVNVDFQVEKPLLVRTEYRYLKAQNAVFSGKSGASDVDNVWLGSIALSF